MDDHLDSPFAGGIIHSIGNSGLAFAVMFAVRYKSHTSSVETVRFRLSGAHNSELITHKHTCQCTNLRYGGVWGSCAGPPISPAYTMSEQRSMQRSLRVGKPVPVALCALGYVKRRPGKSAPRSFRRGAKIVCPV